MIDPFDIIGSLFMDYYMYPICVGCGKAIRNYDVREGRRDECLCIRCFANKQIRQRDDP